MSPDTQQNVLYTIYFIFLHNFEAILYSFGIFVMSIWMFYKPSRAKFLILWGFIILLFAFEYKKHIAEGLTQQTMNSLITERRSYRIERYTEVILSKLVPFVLPILGWSLILGGITTRILKVEKYLHDKFGV